MRRYMLHILSLAGRNARPPNGVVSASSSDSLEDERKLAGHREVGRVAGRKRVHAIGGNIRMHGSLQPDGNNTVLQALNVVIQRVRSIEKERRFIGSDGFEAQQWEHGFDNRVGTAGAKKTADPFRGEPRGSAIRSP